MNFSGYPAPISNYTYTPNQFFDVVLPHFSRGAVRICAYMIRQALGWSNAAGAAHEGNIILSQAIVSERANVSRESVGPALRELMNGRVINCVREPVNAVSGQRGGTAGLYALRWNTEFYYTYNPDEFNGFYDDGNSGCMTRVPDLFFDYTALFERLSVVRVVGCILRNTIGYQAGRGVRRLQVQYSQRQIMERTGITSAGVLSDALKIAKEHQHILETPGYFDRNGGIESRAAVYSIKWDDDWLGGLNIPPKDESHRKTGADQSENRSGDRDRKTGADSPEIRSESHRKSGAGNQSEKQSDIKITIPKITPSNKQQQAINTTSISNTDDSSQAAAALVAFGFDRNTAHEIVNSFPEKEIFLQIEYFPYRTPAQNPQGMLRRAIEGNWAAPPAYQSAVDEKMRKERDADMHKRSQHEKKYRHEYEAYIDNLIESIKFKDPEAWYLFEEILDAEIATLRENPALKADRAMLQRMEDRLRSPEIISKMARDHFASNLPSFWDWDMNYNSYSYK